MKKLTLTLIITLAASVWVSFAQNQGNTNTSDSALKGGGRVNPSTLAMEFSLPLGNYPGRGINVPISMNYSSKLWRMEYNESSPSPGGNYSTCRPHYFANFAENSASGWTTSMATPYIEYAGAYVFYNSDGTGISRSEDGCPTSTGGNQSYPYSYIRRIIVHLPSGETHEMRPDDTAISFVSSGTPSEGPQNPGNWNATYYAADGSNLIYVQNSTNSTYRLLMPDGSFYDFENSNSHPDDRKATTYTDRNGNYTTYNAPNSTYLNGYWTDTLGRTLAIPFGQQPPSATDPEVPIEYAMPGVGGTYKFHWKLLKGASQAESALTTYSDSLRYVGNLETCYPGGNPPYNPSYCSRTSGTYLFGGGESARLVDSSLFNPVVLAEIELPTGTSYKFSYDVYGRMEWIYYPTGGKENFTYAVVPTLSMLDPTNLGSISNFGVVNRKLYESTGDTTPYEWSYSAEYAAPSGYKVSTVNPDGTQSDRFLHRGIDAGWGESIFGYDNSLAGMAYEERGFDSAGNMLSRKLTHWTYTLMGGLAQWHPRVDYEESAVYQADGNGVTSTTRFEYEGNLSNRNTPVLVNKTTQYAFSSITSSSLVYGENFAREDGPSANPTPVPTPTPSASPVRSTELTYLQNDSSYSGTASYYTNQNMIGLVTVSKTKDGSGTVVSHSETKYDESGSSPGYRGNPTSSWVWDSYKGGTVRSDSYPLTTTNAVKTSAVFDSYGNQTASTDANGNTTTTTFDGTHHAFPIQVTSSVPDSTNTYGSNSAFITYATFDYTTGLPLTTKDANNLETRITYDANTLRPLMVKNYIGGTETQVGGTAETIYHDETGNYWVKSKTQIDDTHYAESITYFDGLGRAYKAEEVNSEGNVFVEKEFDSDGRVSRVSNPYRTGDTKIWTTNTYDNASRVTSVTLPDSSTVTTDYGISTSSPVGVTKTITDQAGKKRKGFSDASGNMVRVIEDPTSSALATDYAFDTLGNLRKTVQGEQNRYFMHSSIGRLLFAKQVEQETYGGFSATDPVTGNTAWSAKYEYDDNGNITKTTDAKGWYIEGTYDSFNRIKVRNYSDSGTPDVSFYYDGKGLASVPDFSKGKTTKVTSSASETKYMSFDIFGRLLTHRQTTDSVDYDTAYEYNIAGALVEETYPSTRKVRFTTDQDGDLSQVQSKKNSGSGYWTYADAFSYDKNGQLTKFQLGNGRWENYSYNNRQQITQIGLGTTDAATDFLKLEYSYTTPSTTNNNGSLREQKITVPAVGSNSAFTAIQSYSYDDLNRLQSATETVSSSQTWKQTFTYDRYGNRRFDTTGGKTTTLGICSSADCNPTISTNTNRISQSGYTYDANGSLTVNAAGERFGYDAENHQKEFFVASNSGSIADATYSYDGEGRRIKKVSTTETTIFVYDGGGQLVAEYSTALASVQQVSYMTADHLGSPRVMTNENGAVTNRKDFAAFGDEVVSSQRVSGGSGNGYTPDEVRKDYTGYEKDSESGLQFAQARYYNTTHGRFTSVDPLTASASIKNPQTFNRYSYVLNSPYKFVDPLGLLSEDTGACGTRCPGNNAGGGMGIGLTTGMDYGPQVSMPLTDRERSAVRAWSLMALGVPPQIAYAAAYGRPFNSNQQSVPTNVSSQTDPMARLRAKQEAEKAKLISTINTLVNVVFGEDAYFDHRTIKSPVKGMVAAIQSAVRTLFEEVYYGQGNTPTNTLVSRFAAMISSFGGPGKTYWATEEQGKRPKPFHFDRDELRKWGLKIGNLIVTRSQILSERHWIQRENLKNLLIRERSINAE